MNVVLLLVAGAERVQLQRRVALIQALGTVSDASTVEVTAQAGWDVTPSTARAVSRSLVHLAKSGVVIECVRRRGPVPVRTSSYRRLALACGYNPVAIEQAARGARITVPAAREVIHAAEQRCEDVAVERCWRLSPDGRRLAEALKTLEPYTAGKKPRTRSA